MVAFLFFFFTFATMMRRFILAIGCNCGCMWPIRTAQRVLQGRISDISFTDPVHNVAVGMDGGWFDNLLAYGHTDMSLDDLMAFTKETEGVCGNSAMLRRHDIVMMDIDILLYGNEKLHIKDWNKTYIRKLMEDNNIII